jgi:hypothetical protein
MVVHRDNVRVFDEKCSHVVQGVASRLVLSPPGCKATRPNLSDNFKCSKKREGCQLDILER